MVISRLDLSLARLNALKGFKIPERTPASLRGLTLPRNITSLARPPIPQVSVEQRLEALTAQPQNSVARPEQTPVQLQQSNRAVPFVRNAAIAGTIGLAATLIPKVAYAGSLTAIAASITPLGWVGIATVTSFSILAFSRHLRSHDCSMNQRNANPGDPTLRRQMKYFAVVPAALLAGSGLVYLSASLAASLLGVSSLTMFAGLAAAGLGYGAYKFIRACYQTREASRKTITPGYRSSQTSNMVSNAASLATQGVEAAYAFYRSTTIGFLLYYTLLKYVIPQIVTGAIGAAALAGGAGIGLLVGGVVGGIYLSHVANKRNPLRHDWAPRFDASPRGIRTIASLAVASALGGVLLTSFPGPIINLAFVLAFFFTEAHAFMHNWACQNTQRRVITAVAREYPEREVWQAARRPESPWITVMKPGFEPKDFIDPTYAILYLRKGANWDFNIISGINLGMAGLFKQSHRALEFLRRREAIILGIIQAGEANIQAQAATDLPARYRAMATLYRDLADHWMNDARHGNFTAFGGTANEFSGPHADEFKSYLGDLIEYEGRKFLQIAQALEDRAAANADLSQEEIDETLDGLKRQYAPIFHWFPPKMFRNICPDVIKSKIREIDLFNHLSRTYKTGMSVLRYNRHTGQLYWEILPCKRIWELDTHTNTLRWRTRTPRQMRGIETYSDIRDVDNTGMADPSGDRHSRQAYTYGPMGASDRLTINFKVGGSLTFSQAGGPTVAAQLAANPDRDPVVWVAGAALSDPRAQQAIPKDWKDKSGNIDEVFQPALFHFFGSKYQTMCDGEHADITTSDFLAPLEEDIKRAHVLGLYAVDEQLTVPWDPRLRDRPQDRLVRVSPSYAPFFLRVRKKNPGTLYIPYNWVKTNLARWNQIAYVCLMPRSAYPNPQVSDRHGDKSENIIVAYDQDGNELMVLPYSTQLEDPAIYQTRNVTLPNGNTLTVNAEIDLGLGRRGDQNFVAYTFERPDGTRYMRWLPKEFDWPEMDFREDLETLTIRGNEVVVQSCRWIGKRHYYDPTRLVVDPGSAENPNFTVLNIQGPELFHQDAGTSGPMVAARYQRTAGGIQNLTYQDHTGSAVGGNNLDDVIEQRLAGSSLTLYRTNKANRQILPLAGNLAHPSHFISGVSLRPAGTNLAIEIQYANPFDGSAYPPQVIIVPANQLPALGEIYQGGNQAFAPCIFNQHQRDPRTGDIEERFFLDFYACETETIDLGFTPAAGEEVRLIEVRSSLLVTHRSGVAEWIPFDQEIKPRYPQARLHFDRRHAPFASGLVFGEIDTMIAPQHLVPLIPGMTSQEQATDDQKFYFGEIYDDTGEYNWPYGWAATRRFPARFGRGPFSLQYGKSLAGAALNTGSNTVMRSPHHEGLLFATEELEVYQDPITGRPAPLYKSLFNKTTTTEDAQGAMEKKIMLDGKTLMDRTARSVGGSVKDVGQATGQRGRWAAMIIFLQRGWKLLYDELIRARLLGLIPRQYDNTQLHEWLNTFTWYLDTLFKHVVPLVPFAYMLGLSPLPIVGAALLFPALWFAKTLIGWPTYAYENSKMGVNWIRSFFKNLALYYLWIPTVSRNTAHIDDEAKGEFVSTAGVGGMSFSPWAMRRTVYYFGGLSLLTAGIGLFRILCLSGIALGSAWWAIPALAGILALVGLLTKVSRGIGKAGFYRPTSTSGVSRAIHQLSDRAIAWGTGISFISSTIILLSLGFPVFGLIMNVIWPGFMLMGVGYALYKVFEEMSYKAEHDRGPRSYCENLQKAEETLQRRKNPRWTFPAAPSNAYYKRLSFKHEFLVPLNPLHFLRTRERF